MKMYVFLEVSILLNATEWHGYIWTHYVDWWTVSTCLCKTDSKLFVENAINCIQPYSLNLGLFSWKGISVSITKSREEKGLKISSLNFTNPVDYNKKVASVF